MWEYLLIVSVLLICVWCALKFRIVYQRNQQLSRVLPVEGKIPWLFGGRAIHILRKVFQGRKGLVSILPETLELTKKHGPIFVRSVY